MSVESRDEAPPEPTRTDKRRYICGNCLFEKRLLPRDAPMTVRTGCGNCQRITRHLELGSVALYVHGRRNGGDRYVR